MDHPETPDAGKVIIAPDVLITIAKLSTLAVPGVVRMAPVPGGMDRYFRRGAADGVRILVRDHTISADLYIVVNGDASVRQVSETVQAEVARAMADMVGMEVDTINVHIEDVVFGEP